MNETDLLEVMKTNLGIANLTSTDGMGKTNGWDSLAHVQLIIELESITGKSLDGDLIARLTTVESLVNYFK